MVLDQVLAAKLARLRFVQLVLVQTFQLLTLVYLQI